VVAQFAHFKMKRWLKNGGDGACRKIMNFPSKGSLVRPLINSHIWLHTDYCTQEGLRDIMGCTSQVSASNKPLHSKTCPLRWPFKPYKLRITLL
jgi:hypothetical protein